LVNDDDACGDARTVEEVRWEADNGLNQAVPDEIPADVCLFVPSEEDSVREDDGAFPPRPERLDEMEEERVIAVPGRRDTIPESIELVVLDVDPVRPSLVRKGRVGDREIEGLQLASLVLQLRGGQGVSLLQHRRVIAVEE